MTDSPDSGSLASNVPTPPSVPESLASADDALLNDELSFQRNIELNTDNDNPPANQGSKKEVSNFTITNQKQINNYNDYEQTKR